MKHWIITCILLSSALFTGCGRVIEGQRPVNLTGRPIYAVATTGMVADVVKNVGGARVIVDTLMGAGVDPHLYKASEGDVTRLAEADIVFYSGLHLEAAMGGVLERMNSRVRTVAVAERIDPAKLTKPAAFEGHYDPHVWFDVSMWSNTAEAVRDALAELDPNNAALYRTNADSYMAELRTLDQYVKQRAAELPAAQRVLITAHDAFSYFGQAYGFEVRGLQGISTASEAGTGDVQGLADFIVERKIRAVFVESSVPLRNVEAVQAAVRSRGWDVQIGGELFSDAMGNAGTPEGTYVGMIKHNIDTIVGALSATGNTQDATGSTK